MNHPNLEPSIIHSGDCNEIENELKGKKTSFRPPLIYNYTKKDIKNKCKSIQCQNYKTIDADKLLSKTLSKDNLDNKKTYNYKNKSFVNEGNFLLLTGPNFTEILERSFHSTRVNSEQFREDQQAFQFSTLINKNTNSNIEETRTREQNIKNLFQNRLHVHHSSLKNIYNNISERFNLLNPIDYEQIEENEEEPDNVFERLHKNKRKKMKENLEK